LQLRLTLFHGAPKDTNNADQAVPFAPFISLGDRRGFVVPGSGSGAVRWFPSLPTLAHASYSTRFPIALERGVPWRQIGKLVLCRSPSAGTRWWLRTCPRQY